MRRRLSSALMVALWMLTVVPRPSAESPTPIVPGGIVFRSASHESAEVHFAPAEPIDWAALARRHAGVIDPARPGSEQLRRLGQIRNTFGNSEVRYDAPVGPRPAARFYYLLDGHGATPLRLVRLRGTVRYGMAPDGQSILEVTHFGEIVAERVPPGGPAEGGFVLVATTPLAVRTVRLDGTAGTPSFSVHAPQKRGEAVYTCTDPTGPVLTLRQPLAHPPAIRSSHVATLPDGRRYVVARWTSDRADCDYGCCEFSYSLFEVAATLRELLWSRYECDV